MAIQITNPITVTQETITFDKFWLKNLQIMAVNPNKSPRLIANIEKVNINEDGSFETAPLNITEAHKTLVISDLNKEVSEDTTPFEFISVVTGETITLYTADIIQAVTLKIKQMAEQKGII